MPQSLNNIPFSFRITPKLRENSGMIGFRLNMFYSLHTMCVENSEMLNRNKQDVNSYVNSNDLSRYLAHLRFENDSFFAE
jgi:hypothetical protein